MKKGRGGTSRGEVQVQKSPAEFFAENQAIAGFDNMGKSLYTSIRELVENALDACESIDVLPSISVSVTEMTKEQFNKSHGISQQNKDEELFRRKNETPSTKLSDKAPTRKKASQEGYFTVKVKDNGCGMKHESIPNLLGRVLSGSKYGVRQTRGKYGLGTTDLPYSFLASDIVVTRILIRVALGNEQISLFRCKDVFGLEQEDIECSDSGNLGT